MLKKLIIATIVLSSILWAKGVKPVENKLYKLECGSCHFAFQAGLLPERSWFKLMDNLENHFQDDASLDKADRELLVNYLVKNSSDKAYNYKRSRKMDRSISKKSVPIRITEVPYFIKKHRKVSQKIISQEEVKSLSNCTACHTKAQNGNYDDDYITIPNYGRWYD